MDVVGLSNRSRRSRRLDGGRHRSSAIAIDLSLGAVTRDVARLAAAVAGLARGIEWAAIRSRAIARDVAQLAARIALHGLGLAVARKVVWSSALVAGSRAGAASISAAETSTEAAAGTGAATHTACTRVGAVTRQMAGETARVASTARAGAAQTQGWAVGLDVAEALAVVALLGLGGARVGASVGLVAGLLAVVAEPLGRGAHLSIVADVAALEAGTTGKRRHGEYIFPPRILLCALLPVLIPFLVLIPCPSQSNLQILPSTQLRTVLRGCLSNCPSVQIGRASCRERVSR